MFAGDSRIRTLAPAGEVPEDSPDFPLRVMQAPAMSGTPLRMFVSLVESPLAGPVRRALMRRNGMPQALEEIFLPERPTFLPNTAGWPAEQPADRLAPLAATPASADGELGAAERATAAFSLVHGTQAAAAGDGSGSSGRPPRQHTVASFHAAYACGACTPLDVAEAVIAAIAASEAQNPPMRFFVAHDPSALRAAAAASAARWAAGAPLSPLDGVPYAVKDCVDALPYPTTSGTAFMADWRTPQRSLGGVEALQEAGALLVGKATLHEIGLGTTGLNLATGTARNPHSPAHHTGGSSSGSAALVAAGICPIAVGTDGGGSIRIPAAACGAVGLKPTHGRVGTAWGVPPIDATVAVTGPIASCVADTALMYALMAGTGQRPGVQQPRVLLPASGSASGDKPLAGKRAGVCWQWFDGAAPAVGAACRAAVALLQGAGLAVTELAIPELGLLQVAHSTTITAEMRNMMQGALRDDATRGACNLETRVSLAMAADFSAASYLNSQKVRTRVEAHFRRAFSRCDFILTPSLPCTAPPIKPAALRSGETDLATTTLLMRFMQAANFIGIPGLTVPVGVVPSTHSSSGSGGSGGGADGGPLLPVGLQLMAPCWHEASLLHAGAVLEAALVEAGIAVPLPRVWYDVLARPPRGDGDGGRPAAGDSSSEAGA